MSPSFSDARLDQARDRSYTALEKGEIDAGYLPVDLRFIGQKEFGWNNLAGIPIGAGGIVTTRRLIASNRDAVSRFVTATVETIATFKTRPDLAVPLLQRFLQIDDRKAVECWKQTFANSRYWELVGAGNPRFSFGIIIAHATQGWRLFDYIGIGIG